MPSSPDRQPRPADPGWSLLAWPEFARQLEALTERVGELRRANPDAFRQHPQTKLLAAIRRLVFDVIPSAPDAPAYLQGNTLGPDFRTWRRAKFAQRFRLFFRFHTPARVIVYGWLNDENTLRKAGSRTDAYAVFRAMLQRGNPPSGMADLIRGSEPLAPPERD
jgi:toxin YhaV